jgi:hypothetical protein
VKQFQRLHQEMQEGGFSEHIPTATKPEPPGFMVSDFGPEYKVPSHLNSPQLLETYAKTNGLDKSPPGEFMGGWQEEGNLDYSDVSRQYPDTSRTSPRNTERKARTSTTLTSTRTTRPRSMSAGCPTPAGERSGRRGSVRPGIL